MSMRPGTYGFDSASELVILDYNMLNFSKRHNLMSGILLNCIKLINYLGNIYFFSLLYL